MAWARATGPRPRAEARRHNRTPIKTRDQRPSGFLGQGPGRWRVGRDEPAEKGHEGRLGQGQNERRPDDGTGRQGRAGAGSAAARRAYPDFARLTAHVRIGTTIATAVLCSISAGRKHHVGRHARRAHDIRRRSHGPQEGHEQDHDPSSVSELHGNEYIGAGLQKSIPILCSAVSCAITSQVTYLL